MAKKLVYEYQFNASTRKIKIYDNVSVKKLLLITNVTDNIILYNFADEAKGAASVTFDPITEHTEITLNFDTTSMSDSDQLQIFIEKPEVAFEPSETFVDPVSKIRVSNPENLVDTDFEYGPQASKWETLQLVNNIPSAYSNTSDTTISGIISISATNGSDVIVVTTKFEHNLNPGTPIDVRGLTSFTAEGSYLIQSVPTPSTFTYRCRGTQSQTGNLSGAYSSVIPGQFYSNSQLILDSYDGLLADSRNYIVDIPGGSGGGFYIDGVASPDLTITKNGIFYFTQEANSNTTHRIRFARADQFVDEVTKQIHHLDDGTEGSPVVFATNNTTANVYASDNGYIYTADTDIEIVGSQWLETTYNLTAGSAALPAGPVFNKGAYASTLKLQIRVGAAGLIATSTDNLNWTVQTSGTPNDLYDVDYDGAFFTVVGDSGTVLRSADGTSWTAVAGTTGTTNYRGVRSNSQDLVIVGAGGEIRQSSDGGANLTVRTTSGSENLEAAAWSGQKWTVVGASGAVYTSPDAVTWTKETAVGSANNLTDIKWDTDNDQFVIIGASGTLLTTPDASTFTTRTTGLSNTLIGLACGDGGNGYRIVIIDTQGDGAYSSDGGVNWVAFTTGTGVTTTECYWTGYAFNIFQHTGTPGTNAASTYFSAIQQPYTAIPAGQIQFGASGTVRPRDIVWVTDDNQFVLCADNNGAGTNGGIFVSSAGTSWTEKSDANIPNESFLKVQYAGNAYWFLTEDKLHSTADGTTFATWTEILDKSNITTNSGFSTDTVVTGGSAYNAGTNISLTTLTGDGSGAEATVVVVGGVVSDVTITNAGKDYKQGDRVQISGGNGDAILEVATIGTGVNSTASTFRDFFISSDAGIIAVVGSDGAIVWSINGGTSFEVDNVGTNINLNGIIRDDTYENQYAVVGDAATGAFVATATNLETWTRVPTSNIPVTTNLTSIFFDGERYVAAGAAGSIISSYDGTHWSKVIGYGIDADINFAASFTNTNTITGEGTYLAFGVDRNASHQNESGLWVAEEGRKQYTDSVYETAISPGSTGSYTRIFVDVNTPKYLTYYCQTHGMNMKGNLFFDEQSISKIYMMTEHENGFSTGTDFYVVNTVSPKVVEIVDPAGTAPDGRGYVDIVQTLSINAQDTRGLPLATAADQGYDAPEQTGNQLIGFKGSYELQIQSKNVDYSTNTITFDEDHKLYDGAALYYYPMPGDKPIGGLMRSQVYYVQVVNTKAIRLHNAGVTPSYYSSGVKIDKFDDWDYPVTLREWAFTGMRQPQTAEYTTEYTQDIRYGMSHAISKDGRTCAIGGRYSDDGQTNRGQVWVYQKNPFTNEWDWKQRFQPYTSAGSSQYFGHAVALNKDGTRLIVGAPRTDRAGSDTGSCYVYDRAKAYANMTGPEDYANYFDGNYQSFSGTHVFESNDISGIDNDTSSYMGTTLDINDLGDYFIVGIPRNDENGGQSGVCVVAHQTNFNTTHQRNGGSGSGETYDYEEVKPTDGTFSSEDYFGATVKMAGDQSKIVISADRDDQSQSNSGSVYIFNRGSGNTWTQAQRINSPAPSASAYFGQSIAYSKDTMWLGIAEPRQETSRGNDMGQVHIYNWDSGTGSYVWKQTLECPEGTTNWADGKSSIHFGGNEVDGDNPDGSGKGQGDGLVMSYDGSVMCIGVPQYDIRDIRPNTSFSGTDITNYSNVGAAFTYRLNDTKTGYDNDGKILCDYSHDGKFGVSMAMDQHGEEMVIGAPGTNIRYDDSTVNLGVSMFYSRAHTANDSSESPSAISSVGSDTLTISASVYNTLRDEDVVLYYHAPAASADGSGGDQLVSGTKYYITKRGSNQISLSSTFDLQKAGTYLNLNSSAGSGLRNIKKLPRGATFERGNHKFALCYRIQREEKDGSYQWYYRTMYWKLQNQASGSYLNGVGAAGITYGSGYDLYQYGANSYGLAGAGGYVGNASNVENSMIFHTYRPGIGYPRHRKVIENTGVRFRGVYAEQHNQGWAQHLTNEGCIYPQTKAITGHRGDPLLQPRNTSAERNFYGPYGSSGDSSIAPGNCAVYNDNANPYTNGTTLDGQIKIYGNNREWRSYNRETDVSNWQNDWSGSLYWMPLSRVNDQDTIYSENHNLITNEVLTFNVITGEPIEYNKNTGWNTSDTDTLDNGTSVYVEVVDDNRFRLKTTLAGQPLRLLQLPGTYSLTGVIDNPKRNSMYVEDHQLSENNKVIYSNEGSAIISGLVDGDTYYIDVINGNRFALRDSASVAFTGRARSLNTNSAPSNQTRITRLSITTGLQLGMKVDLIANTQGLSQEGEYEITNVNFTTVNADTNYIEVDNQWGGTATSLVSNVSFAAAVSSEVLSGVGAGQQAFEDQTSDFGVSDGGYKNTVIIDEKTLEINVPFKVRPTKKLFDTSNDVSLVNNSFTIADHFFVTGQKVIYSNNGGLNIGGLLNDTDYYVIQLDDNEFKLAATRAEAEAGTSIALTEVPGVPQNHLFTHANVAGRVLGAGRLDISNGSRRILGTQGDATYTDTSFKRYFKVGDVIRVLDTNTSPSTIHQRLITAIKDDFEMLVDEPFTFTDANSQYFIDTLVYVRPDGYYLHRPFDGGMEIGSSKSPDGLICRQTRKYFRYQSGKGIQTSLAINFNPKIAAKSMSYRQVSGDVYGNIENYSVSNAPGDVSWTFTGDASGSNLGLTLKAGDTLNIAVANGSDNLWITSSTATTGLGPSYADNINVGITNNGTNDGTIKWDTDKITAGTYYFISQQNPVAMRGEIVISDAADGAKNRMVIVTRYPHSVQENTNVIINDSADAEFNSGTNGWKVINLVDDFTFEVDLKTLIPTSSNATGFLGYHIKEWLNSAVRCGMFDFQNGFFFEFDGTDVYCVRRSSTQQMTGSVSVRRNSNEVSGIGTKFTTQLGFGDKVVIRGQTYKVVKVTSDTTLKIQPSYRGTTTDNVLISKTVDTRIPQYNWNMDHCDGTGESGYNLDLTKIQMAYMDYSWYGAGKIRFGFKDQNGHVKYVHEFRHNNRLTESYFRSGNLPARYEIESSGISSHTPTLFHWGTSVMMDGMFQDDDAYLFTASGQVLKYTNEDSVAITTRTDTSYVRTQRVSNLYKHYIVLRFGTTNAQAITAQAAAPVGTYLYNDSITGYLSGFFSDGRPVSAYNETRLLSNEYRASILYYDGTASELSYSPYRSYRGSTGYLDESANKVPGGTIFYAGAPQGDPNVVESNIPIISIRLAPSVDSSIQGLLGEREIINRMQLKLNAIDIQTSYETEVELRLNGALSSDSWYTVDSPSLSQLISHEKGDTISGGLKVFTFRAAGGSTGSAETTTLDLSKLIDLGNSIQGGDGVFPNGPDVLTIVANIIDSSDVSSSQPYTVSGKISWAESQA
jgi:hypothetical protein